MSSSMASPLANKKPRLIVRWNDLKDKCLLLEIHRTCANERIKLPYAKIAENLGGEYTAGAISQHLAKLRDQMDDLNKKENLGLPVPDKIKRGSVTKPPSRVYAQPGKNNKLQIYGLPKDAKIEYIKNEEVDTPLSATTPVSTKGKGKRIKKEISDDETIDDDCPSLYDSDSDYGVPTKKARKTTKTSAKKTNELTIKAEDNSDDDDAPIMQTRGVRLNYAETYGEDGDGDAISPATSYDVSTASSGSKVPVVAADVHGKAIEPASNIVDPEDGDIVKPTTQVENPFRAKDLVIGSGKGTVADPVTVEQFRSNNLNVGTDMNLITATGMPASFSQFDNSFSGFGGFPQNSITNMSPYMQPVPNQSMMFNVPAYPVEDNSATTTRHNSTATTTSTGSLLSTQPFPGQLLDAGLWSRGSYLVPGGFEAFESGNFSSMPGTDLNNYGASFNLDDFDF